jgi:methylthioribose-1-phosphate isomerase
VSDRSFQILTHCNAGWLATVDFGTALAPVYLAHDSGLPVQVLVSETRPRNQGAALTAWELGERDVPHTLVVDNAAGHLLATGQVDVVIVGADRIAANGDTANKIGTSLKALAARHHGVPFYVAAPGSTFDASCPDGDAIPIEERDAGEVLVVNGAPVAPAGTPARNWGFDVTPARLITGLITERGVLAATRGALAEAFPERVEAAARPVQATK